MKVRIDIDCTPEEARTALGLPDVTAINDMMIDEMKKRMAENMATLDPDVLMKNWMSFGGQMQDQFMAMMRQANTTQKNE